MKLSLNNLGFIAPYALIAVFGFLSLGTGVFAVSQNAVPGDALYPLKEAVREIRIAVAMTEEAKAKTEFAISFEKAKEIREMEKRNVPVDAIVDAADKLSENYKQKTEMIKNMLEESEAQAVRISEYINREQKVLEEVVEKVPAPAKEAVERAIHNSGEGLRRGNAPVDYLKNQL